MTFSADAAPGADPPRAGVALVLGASRGLGLLVTRELADRGFVVHGCARDAAELEDAAQGLAP